MTLRRATAADVAALAALRRAWVEENGGVIVDTGTFERDFAQWYAAEAGRRLTWVAAAGDEAVGMLNLVEFHRMPRPGRLHSTWGYISNVFVLAGHRKPWYRPPIARGRHRRGPRARLCAPGPQPE